MPQPYVDLNATTILEVLAYANTVTQDWYWTLMLFAIYIVAFGVLVMKNNVRKSFVASTFFCTILSMMLLILGLVNGEIAVLFMGLSIASVILLLFR